MEKWSGQSPETVSEDVLARVLSKNVVNVVIYEAQRRLDRERALAQAAGNSVAKHRKIINATTALHPCKF